MGIPAHFDKEQEITLANTHQSQGSVSPGICSLPGAQNRAASPCVNPGHVKCCPHLPLPRGLQVQDSQGLPEGTEEDELLTTTPKFPPHLQAPSSAFLSHPPLQHPWSEHPHPEQQQAGLEHPSGALNLKNMVELPEWFLASLLSRADLTPSLLTVWLSPRH